MKYIRSLTLSIDEIAQLLGIEDFQTREQAINIIKAEAANPEEIDPEKYADCHPILHKIISKLRKRVDAAHRRAEARERRKAEEANKPKNEQPMPQDVPVIPPPRRHLNPAARKLYEIAMRAAQQGVSTTDAIRLAPLGKGPMCPLSDNAKAALNYLNRELYHTILQVEIALCGVNGYCPEIYDTWCTISDSMAAIYDYMKPYIELAVDHPDLEF